MKWINQLLKYALIALIVAFFMFPIYWMIITSVKTPEDVIQYPPRFYPHEVNFDSFREALTRLRGGAAPLIVSAAVFIRRRHGAAIP